MTTPTQDFKGKLTTWPAITDFIWAGAAIFTLVSLKTGARFTYRVKAKREDVEAGRTGPEVTYFASLLRGPDNGADYVYIGVMRQPAQFNLTSASRVGRSADSVKALVWFLDAMARQRDILGSGDKGLPPLVEFWTDGRCGRCGRLLSVPTSVADGFGPECVKRRAA